VGQTRIEWRRFIYRIANDVDAEQQPGHAWRSTPERCLWMGLVIVTLNLKRHLLDKMLVPVDLDLLQVDCPLFHSKG
jgi:hypothetical protein